LFEDLVPAMKKMRKISKQDSETHEKKTKLCCRVNYVSSSKVAFVLKDTMHF
jgi:hypothetical protein